MSRVIDVLVRFGRDCHGGITAFVAVIFLMMFVGVGMGVDFMRLETQRAELQGAVDRGILAAAAMTHSKESEETVKEYIRSANLIGPYEVEVTRTDGAKSRRITATATTDVPTYFLKVIGITTLSTEVVGTAFEGMENVEISIVLDISGSMARDTTNVSDSSLGAVRDYPFQSDLAWGGVASQITRLDLMRVAAHNFVSDLITKSDPGTTSISLVPFAGHVNPGRPVFEYLSDGGYHTHSSCIELEDADFTTRAVPTTGIRSQVPQFQWYRFEADYGHQAEWGWCPSDIQAITYFNDNVPYLQQQIAELRAHDGTGTQNGMKWGLGLLDPSANRLIPVINTGIVNAYADETSAATSNNDDDAANTADENGGTATSSSASTGSSVASAAALSDPAYIKPEYQNRPLSYDKTNSMKVIIVMTDGNTTAQVRPRIPPGVQNAGKQEQLDKWLTKKLGEADYWVMGGANSIIEAEATASRTQLTALCSLAKSKGVVVFTIGFDILDGSTAQEDLRTCASEASMFYDVNGERLLTAFDAIIANLTKLKLTQ